MSHSGYSLKELLITCLIIGSFIPIIISFSQGKEEQSRQVKCKSNLDHLGKFSKVYLLDYGHNVLFPPRNGAGFLTTLYHCNLVTDPDVFLCPGTSDDNKDGKELQKITGLDPDKINAVSYAGRKNANQQSYPGIFKYGCNTLTPIAADDIQKENNHIDINIILFVDGHADHIRSTEPRINGLNEDIRWIYDPLTN